jgi:chromosome segregation ATPase
MTNDEKIALLHRYFTSSFPTGIVSSGDVKVAMKEAWDSCAELMQSEMDALKESNKNLEYTLRAYLERGNDLNTKLQSANANLDKVREVLEVVIKRGDEYGHDARKLGVPLGLYFVCKEALASLSDSSDRDSSERSGND